MSASRAKRGDVLDYTPVSAVASGDVVVVGDVVGVSELNIAANKKGALSLTGLYDFPKPAATVIPEGVDLYWDVADGEAKEDSEGGANKYLGTSVQGGAASDDTTVRVRLAGTRKSPPLRYSAVAASAAISNTVTETAFDKSHTIPASTLKVGDTFRVRLQIIATATNSTDTLTLKLKIGSTVIVATAAVDVANGDIGYIEAVFTIRTIGASGTFVATGVQGLGVPGTVTAKPFLMASTAIDTTAAQAITATATWSVASSSNSCRLDVLTVEKLSTQNP